MSRRHPRPPRSCSLRTSVAARPRVFPGGCRGAQGDVGPRRFVARLPVPFAAKRGGGRGDVIAEDRHSGDPVWAISQTTISDLIGLSLNFFFILPLVNSDGRRIVQLCDRLDATALHGF
ncbi:unnamed protein product [Urochloa humidicola]